MDLTTIDWKLVVTFCSGGLAGAFAKHFLDKYNNKIQRLDCHYIEDEVISKLPIAYEDTTHDNLHAKKFKIFNTTNKDIAEVKIVFSFEPQAIIAKCNSYSKAGADVPKGKLNKKNECSFVIKNFNREEFVEVYFEIGNVQQDIFNIIELDIIGVKVRYLDKRKSKQKKPVKLVEKRDLN